MDRQTLFLGSSETFISRGRYTSEGAWRSTLVINRCTFPATLHRVTGDAKHADKYRCRLDKSVPVNGKDDTPSILLGTEGVDPVLLLFFSSLFCFRAARWSHVDTSRRVVEHVTLIRRSARQPFLPGIHICANSPSPTSVFSLENPVSVRTPA